MKDLGNRLWNSFKIAFSMYSKIPMPKSEWTKENMEYAIIFFPSIGLVIGFFPFIWVYSWEWMENARICLSEPFKAIVLLLIPVVITGGIHLDGLLDTADARSSWQDRERRLEILKDSHAGAFAIITCVVYFFFYYGICTMVNVENIWLIVMEFVLSRSFSALAIVTFPKAKGTGLAAMFADNAQKRTVKFVEIIYIILSGIAMIVTGGISGVITFASACLMFAYYYRMSSRVFGGITGDLAGYFLQMCEMVIALAAVLSVLVF